MYCSHFLTRFGSGIVYASDLGVVRVEIPDISGHEALHHTVLSAFAPSEISDNAANMLQRYFTGERIDFKVLPVDLFGLTPFRHRVLNTTRNFTFGEVCSYGQLARECGSPYAARAVGGALASNPIPIIIPCHRVVASDGRLTGFSAPGGERTKRELLKMEGVEFKGLLVVTTPMVIHRTSSR